MTVWSHTNVVNSLESVLINCITDISPVRQGNSICFTRFCSFDLTQTVFWMRFVNKRGTKSLHQVSENVSLNKVGYLFLFSKLGYVFGGEY